MRPPSALGTTPTSTCSTRSAWPPLPTPPVAACSPSSITRSRARATSPSRTRSASTPSKPRLRLLGYVDARRGRRLFHRAVTRLHTTATPFDVRGRQDMPRVDMVYDLCRRRRRLADRPASEGATEGLVPGRLRRRLVSQAPFLEAGKRAVQGGYPAWYSLPAPERPRGHARRRRRSTTASSSRRPDAAEAASCSMLALTVTRER